MLRIVTALSALGLLVSPAVALAKDDCAKDSGPQAPNSRYELRFVINIDNRTTQILTADFYKTVDRKDPQNPAVTRKFSSKAMSPGQKISVVDKVPMGSTTKVETKLASYDGDLTFGSTYFSVWNISGGGRNKFLTGPYDAKITCDRRWNSADRRWIINYVVNPN